MGIAVKQRLSGAEGKRKFLKACGDVTWLCDKCHDRVHGNDRHTKDVGFECVKVCRRFVARGVAFDVPLVVGAHLPWARHRCQPLESFVRPVRKSVPKKAKGAKKARRPPFA